MANLTQDKMIIIRNLDQVIKHAEAVMRTLNRQSQEYELFESTIKIFESSKKALEAAFEVIDA